MIVQEDFLNRLRDFGLNSYESKLWAALLSRGISTAGELSDIANVPRSRSYDVLESLEKKGFIMIKIGKPIKYIAVPPEEVVERVKKRIQNSAEVKTKLIEQFRQSELLDELNLLHKTGIELVDPADLSGCLKGRSNLYAYLDSMIKNAQQSIIISTTEKGLVRKAEEFSKAFKKASEKGVKIRISAPLTKVNKKIAKDLSKYAEVRHTSTPGRFMVVDSKDLAFMVMDDATVHPSYDVGVWVRTHFFANAVEQMFNSTWKDMKPLA
ncbi:MAG: helix-turn-helix domain-containing protein [Candidatus Woesearchaeota archaeon]